MDNPTVTFSGMIYPVPRLVPRQLRQVIPAVMRLAPLAGDPTKITTALYDDILNVLFWGAIWPNNKDANPSCLMDTVIAFDEMMSALKVIRNQTGMFREIAPAEGAQPGEAQNP
jgi:hypothetical protein